MEEGKIGQLIINSPYEEPKQHWKYDFQTKGFKLKAGRRRAGYLIPAQTKKTYDDVGEFVELPLVNTIRQRVKEWRSAVYPGVTGITKRLLEHWNSKEERGYPFFFCQLDAIETLVWLLEAPAADKVGIDIPSDGGLFKRICSKMATGTGKTIVMAMVIAWQMLNKVTYPQDTRFSKNILVIAPGLTVKSRLQVLIPHGKGSYYEQFNIVPGSLLEKMRQGKVLIHNWHTLNWESDEKIRKKKTVDKRGTKSDEAYTREVLGEMANAQNLVVINDEAHHAWRVPAESKIKGVTREEIEEATKWIGGLDRIHKTRSILTCFDFSATPFAPTGKKYTEEGLFSWIVSDFGLNDAIESGLVKTPRIVIRDDALPDVKTYKSKLYHLYDDDTIKDNINRAAQEHEPLPDLLVNAYYLLGKDWLETLNAWTARNATAPPVMISVVNRTETAARIKYSFDHKKIRIDELCVPDKTLHIDSKVLDIAEAEEEEKTIETEDSDEENGKTKKLSKKEQAELLRKKVDTVGQKGMPGEQVRNVISVGMLSEGWDAKTVTHIMGLRAFSSQLLCEQVVGRGLRRTSYEVDNKTGLYRPEYVNIFGIPFRFLPHESSDEGNGDGRTPKTAIEPVPEKKKYEITFPNVIRIDHTYKPSLEIDVHKTKVLSLEAMNTRLTAELAPVVDGKVDLTKLTEIDLEKLDKHLRLQKIIFETARDVFDMMNATWKYKGTKEYLLAQIIRIVEQFLKSDRIEINPPLFNQNSLRRRIMFILNMNRIVQHLWEAIRFTNTEKTVPVFDKDKPLKSTGDMRTWYTSRPCQPTKKSHINHCVYDSTWEASESYELDHYTNVEAWVKNDHLGFEIVYVYDGVVRKYYPDFIIRLKSGRYLILETKGQDSQQDKTKREFLEEWVKAVNQHGGFGLWQWAVSRNPKDIKGILGMS